MATRKKPNPAKPVKGKKKLPTAKRPKATVPSKKQRSARGAKKAVESRKRPVGVRKSRVTGNGKKNSPRTESKKRRKPTKKQLRERALKGWITRRKFEQIDSDSKKVQKIVLETILPNAVGDMRTGELLQELATYRIDGTKAVEPSILRHINDTQDLYERLWRTQAEPDIEGYVAISKDEIANSPKFRSEALRISQQYEVPLREVYTLFFSP